MTRIVGIRTNDEGMRKTTLRVDLDVALLVRQIARVENRNVSDAIGAMLAYYVKHAHPEWDVVTDGRRAPATKPTKASRKP